MSIKDALAWGTKQLKNTSSGALDASVLLAEALRKPKEFLYTYPEKNLSSIQAAKFRSFILRRKKHEPLAYIICKKEFYDLDFLVSPAVLIPRPETETLVSAVLSTVGVAKPCIIDIGTGSGAIAVTLAKLLPKAKPRSEGRRPSTTGARVFASDINPESLAVAKKNARRLGAKIIFKKGGFLFPFKSLLLDTRPPIVITANLPYLSDAEWRKTQPEVKKYEPTGALVGGKRGWEIYKKLFRELSAFAGRRITLFIEIGWNQKPAIEKLAKKILHPQKIEFFEDLAGKWRVAKIIIKK